MRNKNLKAVILIAASILGLYFYFAGCDDCPNCPEQPADTQEHYKMFVLARNLEAQEGVLLVMDIPADTIIDSVTIAGASQLLDITPDNQKIITTDSGYRVVYNTSDLTYDRTLDWIGRFYFDRSRNIGLIDTGDELLKFDPTDFQVLDSITGPFGYGQIDTTNAIIYLSRLDVVGLVYRIDYLTMSIVDSILIRDSVGNPIMIFEMLPVPEYDRFYFRGKIGITYYSFIYDLKNNQVVSAIRHSTQYGTFLKGVDGHTVYMSDPGNEFFDLPGSHNIWAYSLPYDSVIGFYSTLITDALGTRYLTIQDMLLTPDGMYMYAGCGGWFGGVAGLLRYDLSTGLATSVFSGFYPLLPVAIELGEKIE